MIEASKEGSFLVFRNESKEVRYDLKDGSMYRRVKGELKKTANINSFFSGTDPRYENWFQDDDKYYKFFKAIASQEKRCTNAGTLLNRLRKYAHLEQYIVLGIRVSPHVRQPLSTYSSDIVKFFQRHNNIELSERFERNYISHPEMVLNVIRYAETKFKDDEEIWKNIIDMLYNGYQFGHYVDAVKTYRYDYRRLIDYIFEYVERYEAYSWGNSIGTLIDYARMQTMLTNNGKFEKYPRYLRTVHDIVARNHNIFKQKYSEELFSIAVDRYKHLEYKDNTFSIISPTKVDDLKMEGSDLHHCVGSYVQKVIDLRSCILFLRKNSDLQESLVTIEVVGDSITQARGMHNRSVSEKEDSFLRKFAKNKKLRYKGEEQ